MDVMETCSVVKM